MGVSFKVAKVGTRYRPKPVQVEDKEIDTEPAFDCHLMEDEVDAFRLGDEVAAYSTAMNKPGLHLVSKDPEVSFSLSLFPRGFTIGKPNELFDSVPRQLHPYDRASETLFCAIESGRLPGDILDDLPCKYVNGALFCEIRDYRNLLPQNGDNGSSMDNSPVKSKVVLQMCTESVVKDISSISDNSWTYNDLLEFESQILKALRPDLQLDPTPMLSRLCEESLTEKLNLGISWSRKRRKLSEASTTDHISSIASSRIKPSEVCGRNSNFQSDGEFQDGVSRVELLVTSQTNNTHQENIPHYSLLTYQSNSQSAVDQYLPGALTLSHALSAPKPNYCYVDRRIPSSFTLDDGGHNKITKKEPQDVSQVQLSEKKAKTKLPTKSKQTNKLLNQQSKAVRLRKKMHPPPCRINGQQAVCAGIPRLQRVSTSIGNQEPSFIGKQEPIETSSCQSSNIGARDKRYTLDLRTDGPNLLQSEPLQSSGFVSANVPANAMQSSPVFESAGKNTTQELVTQGQRGKDLQHFHVSSGTNASIPSCLSNSWPRHASVPTKEENHHLKDLCENVAESLAGTNAENTASSPCLLLETPLPWPWPSIIEDLEIPVPSESEIIDPVLDRFSKAEIVSQKYVPNKRKRKFDQIFARKSFSSTAPLLSSHLLNSEDKNLKDGNTDTTCYSECSQDNNQIKTRKFTFERTLHVLEGNGAPRIEARDKVSIVEKLNEVLVEATLTYGNEVYDPIESCLLLAFANTHHADLFVAQFSSGMKREGYHLGGDQVQNAPHDVAGSSSSHPHILFCPTPAAETVELVPPTPITGQSPNLLNPFSSSVSTFIPMHASSQNNFSGGHLLPPFANIQSALPLSACYFSTPPLEIASQLSPMHPQWQHIMNRRAFLQLQMLQRDRLQQQLLQKRMIMMGGFDPAQGLGGGAHGTGNVDLGYSFGNLGYSFGNAPGYMSLLGRGNIQGTGSSGGKNSPAAVAARRIRMAENGGGALMSGFSVDGSAGVSPSNFPMGAYQTTNLLPSPMQMQHQLYMQKFEEIRSLIQPPEATGLPEHVGPPPLSPSSLIEIEQHCRISSQALVPHQLDSGNITVDSGSPGLGSQTPLSVGSCSLSPPLEFHGITKGKSTQS